MSAERADDILDGVSKFRAMAKAGLKPILQGGDDGEWWLSYYPGGDTSRDPCEFMGSTISEVMRKGYTYWVNPAKAKKAEAGGTVIGGWDSEPE